MSPKKGTRAPADETEISSSSAQLTWLRSREKSVRITRETSEEEEPLTPRSSDSQVQGSSDAASRRRSGKGLEKAAVEATGPAGSGKRKRRPPATFRRLPGPLVFPNLPSLGVYLLASGLTKAAVTILAAEGSGEAGAEGCGGCVGLAIAVLAFVLLFTAHAFSELVRFAMAGGRQTWEGVTPESAAEVEDPLYRLGSRLLVRLGGKPMDRAHGGNLLSTNRKSISMRDQVGPS